MSNRADQALNILEYFHDREINKLARVSADHKLTTPRAGCEEKHRNHRERADALFWVMQVLKTMGEEV